mmetsp:Transcript_17090/g.42807  ORF Transcript_17090/g.42807 Transcript_17090/m.42807 type:complete len:473 (+) Transcript_17090:896-2314(+)
MTWHPGWHQAGPSPRVAHQHAGSQSHHTHECVRRAMSAASASPAPPDERGAGEGGGCGRTGCPVGLVRWSAVQPSLSLATTCTRRCASGLLRGCSTPPPPSDPSPSSDTGPGPGWLCTISGLGGAAAWLLGVGDGAAGGGCGLMGVAEGSVAAAAAAAGDSAGPLSPAAPAPAAVMAGAAPPYPLNSEHTGWLLGEGDSWRDSSSTSSSAWWVEVLPAGSPPLSLSGHAAAGRSRAGTTSSLPPCGILNCTRDSWEGSGDTGTEPDSLAERGLVRSPSELSRSCRPPCCASACSLVTAANAAAAAACAMTARCRLSSWRPVPTDVAMAALRRMEPKRLLPAPLLCCVEPKERVLSLSVPWLAMDFAPMDLLPAMEGRLLRDGAKRDSAYREVPPMERPMERPLLRLRSLELVLRLPARDVGRVVARLSGGSASSRRPLSVASPHAPQFCPSPPSPYIMSGSGWLRSMSQNSS